jgi:hypothetical protein
VPKRLREFLVGLCVSSAIALAALLMMEAALRLLYPEKLALYRAEDDRIRDLAFRFHPEYLISLKAGVEKTFQRAAVNGGETIRWSTNDNGYRGDELSTNPDIRVVVYGDSNVQARFSSLEDTYAERLEAKLMSRTGRDVEVVNAGVVGFGPDQALLKARAEIDDLQPDVLIFVVFTSNDFGDLVRNRLFHLDYSGDLVRTDFPASVDVQLRNSIPRLLIVRAGIKVVNSLTSREGMNAAPNMARSKSMETMIDLAADSFSIYDNNLPRRFSHFADHYDLDVAAFPDSEPALIKKRLFVRILSKIKDLADENEAELFLLVLPSPRDLTENLSPNYTDFKAFPNYRQDALSAAVVNAAESLGVSSIDLFGPFQESGAEDLYFKQMDDHWNDAGQDLAADITVAHIVDASRAFHVGSDK